MAKLRILVFGGTGVGKTSVCNSLTGRRRAANSNARGVTTKSHRYAPFKYGEDRIELVDTAGLHESDSGTVPADEALMQLVDLIEQSAEGFNLLIHVSRASRITQDFEKDHEYFVQRLTDNQIPVMLVATHCDNITPMQSWAKTNARHFEPLGYKSIVATCFGTGGELESYFAPRRVESKDLVLKEIARLALREPHLLYGPGTASTLAQKLAQMWNALVPMLDLPQRYRLRVNESAYDLMIRLKIPQAVARSAVEHLPDLLARVAPVPYAAPVLSVARTVLKFVAGKVGTTSSRAKKSSILSKDTVQSKAKSQ